MEGVVKPEVNGSPLPQRNSKANNANNQVKENEGGVPDKKPRFSNVGGNSGPGVNMGGGGGGGSGGSGQQNQGNMNMRDGMNRQGSRNNRFGRGQQRNQGRGQNREGGGGNDNAGPGAGGNSDRRDYRDRNDRNMGDRRKGEDYMFMAKLKNLSGPTHELPPIEIEEGKFSGRNRLYIGNLTNDITEEEIRELFKPYGEISEPFINAEKNFAFLKVDFHINAEKAKRELDGSLRKNRPLRVRFAPNATVVRVKNLTPFVSNELLYKAFEVFGPLERAVVVVDDRGKSTGEGIVEFARRAGATAAIRYCTEKCYFLTSSLRPCIVESYEINEDADGYPDKQVNKKSQDFFKARQVGPRFADVGTFEHEYGTRWKQLHELYKQKQEALKRELQMEEEKLEAQMEYARYEHETELLREQLRQREQDRERQKMEWELKERQAEEQRNREEEQMRRQQDEMQMRMSRQDEELRRRQQENTLFMQAQQLNSLLDQQEINQGGNPGGNLGNSGNQNNRKFDGNNRNFDFGGNMGGGNMGGNMGNNQGQGFLQFDIGQDNKQNCFDDQNQSGGIGVGAAQMNQRGGGAGSGAAAAGGGGGGGGAGANMGTRQWNDRRGEDFQNKRRRF